MKTNKALIGIAGIILSVTTIVVMAAIRTDDFTHAHKAVSELGAVSAPLNWIFNVFGYVIPGAMFSVFAFNLKDHFGAALKRYPFNFLLLSGVFFFFAGVFPVDMDKRDSLTSILHAVGSLGSGIFWLLCSLTLWWQLKKVSRWKIVAIITLMIPVFTIIAISFIPEDKPGFAQRIAFAGYFFFILVLSVRQWRDSITMKSY